MPFSIRIVRSQVDSRHGFGSPTNLSHRNVTFFYEKRAELAFNKREKHSRHIACHIRFVFACFLGKFRLSDPSASLFEISPPRLDATYTQREDILVPQTALCRQGIEPSTTG